jgi:hypothetical protein
MNVIISEFPMLNDKPSFRDLTGFGWIVFIKEWAGNIDAICVY